MSHIINKEDQNAVDKKIFGSFTLQAQMENGKAAVINGYVYDGDTKADIDARMDMYHACIERQRRVSELPKLRIELKQATDHYEAMLKAFGELTETERKGGKLSSQEETALRTTPINLTRAKKNIEDGERAIADAEKEIG